MNLRSGAFYFVTFAALVILPGGNLMASDARAQSQGDWIDVHFHLMTDKGDLESFDEAARMALQVMDAERIRTIVVMSPPRPRENFDIESLAAVVKKHGPRIVMLGGGGTLNPMLQEAGKSPEVAEEVRRRFEETAQRIIASGAKGFGEITAHHVSLSPSHGYESVPADHPLLLLLADIAAQHDVPIDLHFDPVPADVEKPFSLSSPRNPAVLRDFPDRFVIGSDNFVVPARYTGPDAPRILILRLSVSTRFIPGFWVIQDSFALKSVPGNAVNTNS